MDFDQKLDVTILVRSDLTIEIVIRSLMPQDRSKSVKLNYYRNIAQELINIMKIAKTNGAMFLQKKLDDSAEEAGTIAMGATMVFSNKAALDNFTTEIRNNIRYNGNN